MSAASFGLALAILISFAGVTEAQEKPRPDEDGIVAECWQSVRHLSKSGSERLIAGSRCLRARGIHSERTIDKLMDLEKREPWTETDARRMCGRNDRSDQCVNAILGRNSPTGGLFMIVGRIYDRDANTVYVLGRAMPADASGKMDDARLGEFGTAMDMKDMALAIVNPPREALTDGRTYNGYGKFLRREVGQNRVGGAAPILVYQGLSLGQLLPK